MHEDDWDEDDDIEIVEMNVVIDVVCERNPPERMDPRAVCTVNLPQFIVSHSPAGYEWGYGGSGPHDLSLNILHMYLPPGVDLHPPVKLFRGTCSQVAWVLHFDFCREFIATLPEAGGVIRVADVQAWIRERWTAERGYADPRFNVRFPPRERDQEQSRDTVGGPDL